MRHLAPIDRLAVAREALLNRPQARIAGEVLGISGLAVSVGGLCGYVTMGDRLDMPDQRGRSVLAEVIGISGAQVRAMSFEAVDGLGDGTALLRPGAAALGPSRGWLGRVIDPLGRPLDGKGALASGAARPVQASPPAASLRDRLGPRIDLGVRALNLFATCRRGQRLGLFAGSGIGKSTMLAMLARRTDCDVVVLALVGERGREVREFLEDDLGADGLARSVVVAATSDAAPLMRREAAYAAMTVAEHFRDNGASVLLLMDSVTRFCLALREIGLSAGEPPATRGYPPSVFAELPRLLERAGPGPSLSRSGGSITGIFTVLVEGDDHNEPVADAVRGILDGHVTLDRRIAETGRYPAIDVLRTLSRGVAGCNAEEENALVRRARCILANYADVADLIRLGAYKEGSDAVVDEAVRLTPRIEAMLRQDRLEHSSIGESFASLRAAIA